MNNIITLSSGSEDEDDSLQAHDSTVTPMLSLNNRLHGSITISKGSPKKVEKDREVKDRIEVKSLSKSSQSDIDFQKFKKKYGYVPPKNYSPNSNVNNNEVPNIFKKPRRNKSEGSPELVDLLDIENEKPAAACLEIPNNGSMPKIVEVKSIASESKKKNISELICALAGVPVGAPAFTQIDSQKTKVLEKEFFLEKKNNGKSVPVLNPFANNSNSSPLKSIAKKSKSAHKSSANSIRPFLSETKRTADLSGLRESQPKPNSNENLNSMGEKDYSVKTNDDVEIVSLEADDMEENKAAVGDKPNCHEEKVKRKGEDNDRLEEKAKKKRVENARFEEKVKRKKEDSPEVEEKFKRLKVDIDVRETYDRFIATIKSIEKNLEDREKIVKKFTKNFNSSDPSYVNSEAFNSLLESSIRMLKEEPLKLYHVLNEIFENLKCRREMKVTKKKVPLLAIEDRKEILKEHLDPEENRQTPVLSKKIEKAAKRLAKTMNKLEIKIKKLEEAEVDLDDEENSAYFRMQKYRERFCQVYLKYCEYVGESPDALRVDKRRICFSGTKIPSVNKCIERWLNKTKQFPDYSDIFKLIKEVNETENLLMTPDRIHTVAETAFQDVGKMLRRRRQYDLYHLYSNFFDNEDDPADSDPNLSAALMKNREDHAKKIDEIINLYAEKQGNAKGEEVPDDEIDRSVESDDEDEKEIEEVENGLQAETSDEEDDDKILKNGDDEVQALSPSPEEMDKLPSSPSALNNQVVTNEASLTTPPVKESKNNYKHCKSLKWRLENNSKFKSDLCNGDNKLVSDNKTENNLNCLINDGKCEDDLSADENLKLVENDKPKTDSDKNEAVDDKKDLDCEIIEFSPPKSKFEWVKDNGMKKNSFLVNYVSVEHSFKSCENNFSKKFKFKKLRDKTLGFALNDLTNLNGLDACKERGRRNFKVFTKKSHKENLNPMLKDNYYFFNRGKVFKLACEKKFKGGFYCTLENKENDVRVNGDGNGNGEEREEQREENQEGQENENSSGSGNGDGNNNNGNDESRREKSGDEENEEEDEKEEEEEDCANGNYDAETDSESNSMKDEEKDASESVGEKEEELNVAESEELGIETEEEGERVKEAEEEQESGKEEVGQTEESVRETGEEEEMGNNNEEEAEEPVKEMEEEMTGESVKDLEENNESGGESREHATEERESGEESNSSAGTEQGEVKEGDDVTEKKDVKIEVKKEEEDGNREEEEGKTDVNMIIKTEESKLENEESEQPKNENDESEEPKKEYDESEEPKNENDGPEIKNEEMKEDERTEEVVKEDEKTIDENGESETTNEETKEDNAEALELTCESDQDEARPSTSKRKEYVDTGNSSDVEVIDVKKPKFTSDEELVKNFLQHSPSSISITPPRKSQYSKPPSAEALQALATLRQFKNITTTRVRRRRNENGDVIVIREPPTRERNNFVNIVPTSTPRVRHQIPQNRNRGGLPVISNVQSINRNRQSNNLTPKIVTVQGNVSNFYNRSNNFGFPNRINNTIPGFNHFPQFNNQFNNFSMFNNRQPQSSLKISNVRGNISFGPQPQLQRRFVNPTTSFRQTAPSSSTGAKDKDKKPVEYVVLD